jgi:HD-GYP domain-containing protein (c-di-GMP phosphodiesterase class II)/integral membrane sensor domain MASE1
MKSTNIWRRIWKPALIVIVYLVIFLALDHATLAFLTRPGVTLWYPPEGLSFALLLAFGVRFAPAFLLAVITSNFWTFGAPAPALSLLLWSIFITFVYTLVAALLRHQLKIDLTLRRIKDVILFVLLSLFASTILGLAVVTSFDTYFPNEPHALSNYLVVFSQWWTGEAIGLLTVTPFVLIVIVPALRTFSARWSEGHRITWHLPARPILMEMLAQLISIFLTLWIIFKSGLDLKYGLYYLAFLPLLWISLRHGIAGAAAAILAINFGSMLFIQPSRLGLETVMSLQLFMLMLSLTGLLVGAITAENRQAGDDLKRRVNELEAWVQASKALGSTSELQPLMENLLQIAKRTIPSVEKGTIILRNGNNGILRVCASIGYADPRVQNMTFGEEQGYVGRVVVEARALLIDDAQTDFKMPKEGEIPEVSAIQSSVSVPLIVRGKVIGALSLDNASRKAAFGQDELRLLTAFGASAAMVIENARLFEETRRRTDQMTSAGEMGRILAATLDMDKIYKNLSQAIQQLLPDITTIFISRFDQQQEVITAMYGLQDGREVNVAELPAIPLSPPGESTQSEVIRTRKPLIVPDLRKKLNGRPVVRVGSDGEDTASAMYVPIQAQNQILGVVQVQSYILNRFSEADAELLTLVGNTAGVAIQNSLLFAETNRRIKNLDALHTIDTAITSSLDLQLTLSIALKEIVTQLDVAAADILLFNPLNKNLEYSAGHGFRTHAIERSRIRLGEGYAGRVGLERKIVHIPNLSSIDSVFTRIALLSGESFVSYSGAPLIAKGEIKGVLEIFHQKPLKAGTEWVSFLEAMAGQVAIAIDNAQMFTNLQKSNIDLLISYDATIEGWSHALDLHDKETKGNTQWVSEMTINLARQVGMVETDLVQVRRGVLLHDIGNLGIPDHILLKPGPLTDEEWVIMRKHPQYAFEMLSPINYLRPALDIPYCHHEKWDGSGYPRKLKAEQIPLSARIFAVVDVYDALSSDRSYRRAWTKEKALEYIRGQIGKHFDPRVAELFLRMMEE